MGTITRAVVEAIACSIVASASLGLVASFVSTESQLHVQEHVQALELASWASVFAIPDTPEMIVPLSHRVLVAPTEFV